ncbi:hypothetical protein EIP86_002942 [Pleurotus ostreatoroseus]|nr:hypothetical protein EIP86_002942 [Pleurotus ostreatoroseus]
MSRATTRPRKRQRGIQLGAPQEDDADIPTPNSQANAPSSVAWSRRVIPPQHAPSLSMLCMRAFARGLHRLHDNTTLWEHIGQQLKELPRSIDSLTQYLLRGASIVLTDDLPGVSKFTVSAIGTREDHDQLSQLRLRGLDKFSDDLFASVVSRLPSLKTLNLR